MKPSLVHVLFMLVIITVIPTIVSAQIGGDIGYYSITSDPTNADVHFDGNYEGTTPVTIEVYTTGSPGHTVSVSMAGYQTATRSLSGNPPAGGTIEVTIDLVPIPVTLPVTLPGS